MKRLFTAACGLTAIGALSAILFVHSEPRSFAQQPTRLLDNPDIFVSENPEQAAAGEAVFRAVGDVEAIAFENIEHQSSMREEYLKLLSRKAELMHEDELAGAFDQLRTEVTELEAGRKLEAISAELQTLIDSHPDTAAARRAEAMLNPPTPVEDVYSESESVPAEAAAASSEADLQADFPPSQVETLAEPVAIDPNQPSFIEFNEVVVNVDEGRLNRYLDVRLTVQVPFSRHEDVSARIENNRPILQNWLISHLSAQTLEALRGAAGQERLRTEIKDHFNAELFEGEDAAIDDVLFERFAVQ